MKKNIYSDIPNDLPEELVEVISESKGVRIERIVSRGHRSPEGFWYDQEENEFVLLVSGEAELLFEEENESVRLEEGDYLVIPAHKRHRVTWTAPDRETVWLAVHFKLAPSAQI